MVQTGGVSFDHGAEGSALIIVVGHDGENGQAVVEVFGELADGVGPGVVGGIGGSDEEGPVAIFADQVEGGLGIVEGVRAKLNVGFDGEAFDGDEVEFEDGNGVAEGWDGGSFRGEDGGSGKSVGGIRQTHA